MRRLAELTPLRWLGLMVLAGAVALLRWVALPQRDLVLLVVSSGILLVAALSVLAVLAGAVIVAWTLRGLRPPGTWTLETGRSLPSGFRVPSLLLLPLVQVRWSWETPDAAVSITRRGWWQREDVVVPRRGIHDRVVRHLVVDDVFGLARIGWRSTEHRPLRILPHGGALDRMPTLASMSAGDEFPHPLGAEEGDRIELRRYAPGDPLRLVHWKIFARTRTLMVRKPERALTQTRRTVAYLISGKGDEASAGAAKVAVESGALGSEWTFAADGSDGETSVVAEAVERIVRSALPESEYARESARGLEACLQRADQLGPSSLVLFAPSVEGPWVERALAVLGSRAQRAKVIIAVDGLAATAERSWWWRLLTRETPADGAMLEELESVWRRLAATRCSIVILDRQSGKPLATEHREGMRGLHRAIGTRSAA